MPYLDRVLVAAGILLTVGCSASSTGAELAASRAWARPTPDGATNGVVYLTLTTDVGDELVGASVPPQVADTVELHATTVQAGGGAHVHGAPGGETVAMGEVAGFELVPGEPLEFEPGGNHLMLVGLRAPLRRDEEFDLNLTLASGRELVVPVVVIDNPPR